MPSDNADEIQIAFSADCGYLPHAATMLRSLLTSNPGERFAFHLLQGPDLSVEDSRRLENWLGDQGIQLNRISVSEELLRGFHSGYFHRSIWYRILLPTLLPQSPKILYLDADTLVVDPIRTLWETDISRYLFGAVVNPLYPFMPNWPVDRLGVPDRQHYMNSGVLLLNLEQMRQDDCVGAMRQYSHANPENTCAEQDALAALYHQRCLFLHPRWNVQTTFYELRLHELPVNREDVLEARSDPAIVHFIGPHKPSHYLCRHPYRDAYLHHRQSTPWPLIHPDGRTLTAFVQRRIPIVWAVYCARILRFLLRRLGLRGSKRL